MKRLAMCLAILAIMTAKVFAQAPVRKIPIFFQCTCDDPVGSRTATAVRDLIAISPRYFKSGSEFTRQGANIFPIWSTVSYASAVYFEAEPRYGLAERIAGV
jgi:hypothetical protein